MKKKIFLVFVIAVFTTGIFSLASAEKTTGTLKGIITDAQGHPLPGATVYISSPSFLGLKTYITQNTGKIYFPGLPSGKYKVTVEMPGFKTTNLDNIIVKPRKTVHLKVKLEPTSIEEEITVSKRPPLLDKTSSKISFIMDKNLIENLPFARDLYDVVNASPGVISGNNPYRRTSSVHGSPVRDNTYLVNGSNITDPRKMYPAFNVNFDIIDEIELETSGHPAETGLIKGGYINVITKPGDHNFKGQALFHYTGEELSQPLWSEEEISSTEAPSPVRSQGLYDTSLSFGGSILEDRGWFFANARYISHSRNTPFSPWTDPMGNSHPEYSWNNQELLGSFKLSGRVTNRIRFSGMFNYTNGFYRPFFQTSPSRKLTQEATRIMDHQKSYMGTASVRYTLKQNVFVFGRASYLENDFPLLLNEKGRENPQFIDAYTGYRWGSASSNQHSRQKRLHAQSYISLFEGSFFHGTHEIKAGAEYEFISGTLSTWKNNNLTMYYRNGNPYYYGLSQSPSTGNTVGLGKIRFYTSSQTERGFKIEDKIKRLGLFLQDQSTFAERLSLNVGLRMDLSFVQKSPGIKLASGNSLSVEIGEYLIEPLYGINPYQENPIFPWSNFLFWNSFSPRLGLSFDVFGNNKTIFFTTFSRYSDSLSLSQSFSLSAFPPGNSHLFYWYDENSDKRVDSEDTFGLYPDNYLRYREEYYKKRLDPNIKAPYTDEFTIGIKNEIMNNFYVRVNFIYKKDHNIPENVLYDPESDHYWYSLEQAPEDEKWWIPFNTIVPGTDDYSNKNLTVYFPSAKSPYPFDRFTNVPELTRKYQALELMFKKRMSNNWQLAGSMVYSSLTGNIGSGYESSSGFSQLGKSPNDLIHHPSDSKLAFDRPLSIKLMGTYRFPYDFHFSFFYRYLSGKPWARSVTIIPPSSWIEEKNARYFPVDVLLERPGERRKQSFNNMDIRIRKDFSLKQFGSLNVSVDILNALGNQYRHILQNEGGFWFPQEEDSSQGTRIVNPDYKKVISLSGVRVLKLTFSFTF
ncbi:TonB-dependent receptor [bacterium]|nr:TonB-dependent receptor [bacterium]